MTSMIGKSCAIEHDYHARPEKASMIFHGSQHNPSPPQGGIGGFAGGAAASAVGGFVGGAA